MKRCDCLLNECFNLNVFNKINRIELEYEIKNCVWDNRWLVYCNRIYVHILYSTDDRKYTF